MNTNTPRFHRSFALALCASVLGLAACGDGTTPATPAPGDEVRSTHARITAPAVPAADRASLVAGNTRFAADVYRALAAEPGNVIYSPHSISIALGMTWAGARNNTERQMAQTLRFGMSQAQTHAAFNALDQELAHRAERAPEGGGRPFRLRVVNKLWGQRGYRFQPSFLDTLAENYGAGLNVLNFMGDPEGSRGRINAWVSEQTEGKIPMLLGQGSIVPSTTLVLTNAVYFSASWREPFDPARTAPGDFHFADGTVRQVPLMNRSAEMRYAEGEGWQAAELPYAGDEVSMLVIVPTAGTFDAFERAFDTARVASVVDGLRTRLVSVTLPTFTFRRNASIKRVLTSLGMTDAFSGEADFSGMDGTRSLYIQDVIHEGFIAVDERGTEAAAATAVVVGRTSVPEPATLRADRPFLFAIRDNPTGAILFLGRVSDPSAR
jgi:serpin B